MVEQKGSSNTPKEGKQLPNLEEMKNEDGSVRMTTMYQENFPSKIKEMLNEVPMNPLEQGLLDAHLKNFDNIQANVSALLHKLDLKAQADPRQKRARKQIERVNGLFDKHDFWSTQPV